MSRSNRDFSTEPHLIRRWNGLALLVEPAERRVSHLPVGTLTRVARRYPGIEVFDIRGNLLGRFGRGAAGREGTSSSGS